AGRLEWCSCARSFHARADGAGLAADFGIAAAAFGRTRPMWGQPARCTSSTAAVGRAVNAAQRAAEFLGHGVKWQFERGAPSDQHIVVTGAQRRRSTPDQLA